MRAEWCCGSLEIWSRIKTNVPTSPTVTCLDPSKWSSCTTQEAENTHTQGNCLTLSFRINLKPANFVLSVFSVVKNSWAVPDPSITGLGVCVCLKLYYECYANWVLSAVHAEVVVRNLTSVCRVIQLMLASQQQQQVVMCCCFCVKETFQRLCSTHEWCQHMEDRNNEWCVCSRSV